MFKYWCLINSIIEIDIYFSWMFQFWVKIANQHKDSELIECRLPSYIVRSVIWANTCTQNSSPLACGDSYKSSGIEIWVDHME